MFTLRQLCGLLLAVLICSLPPISGQNPAANTPETRIDGLRQQFNLAYTAGDAAGLAGLFTEDAMLMPPGAMAVVGRQPIQVRYAEQFASVRSSFALKPGVIRVSGDIAWLRGEYQRIDTTIPGSPPATITGKYLMTFRREGSDWKITTDAWNANEPQVDAQVALHGVRGLVKWRMREVASTLKLLASMNQVKSGDWNSMKPLLASFGNTGVLANAIWFVRPDGYYYTVEKDYTGLSLSGRSYFPALIAGQSVLGTLVISLSTGSRSVIIAEPVFNQTQQVIGGIGVSYSVDQLSQEIDYQMQLPAQTIFYALDMSGQTALHRDPALMFEYPSDMGSPTLRSAVEEMLAKQSGTVIYVFRSIRRTVFFERSSILGWVFALGFGEPAIGTMP
jgi:ketosteroid isomerase-like protein